MATELGAISITGLVTCTLCDWSETRTSTPERSKKSQLILHWLDDHPAEFRRAAPKGHAEIPAEDLMGMIRHDGADAATELTRHDQTHGHYEEGQ